MGYGFRLYEVKLVKGSGKSKAVPFDECGVTGSAHVGTWVNRLLTILESHDALTKMPQLKAAVDDDDEIWPIAHYEEPGVRGDPQIDFRRHRKSTPTRIRFEFNFGNVGRVPFAMAEKGGDYTDLTARATGHIYRGLFYLPTSGEKGVLALETVPNGPHPVHVVNQWLARAAIVAAEQDQVALDARDESDRQGLQALPFKLNFNQIVNLSRLEKALKETAGVELVLKKTTINKEGKKSSEKVRMTTQIETQAERAKAVQVARSLLEMAQKRADKRAERRALTGDKPSSPTVAVEVVAPEASTEPAEMKEIDNTEQVTAQAGMLELESLAPADVSGLGFNDGYIRLDDGAGSPKKIGLEVVDRFFEYPVPGASRQQPSAKKWEQSVALEVVSLQGLLGVELDLS